MPDVNDQAMPTEGQERKVSLEIQGHGMAWCHPNCDTFLPQSYREGRIVHGRTAHDMQHDYDSCHIWR